MALTHGPVDVFMMLQDAEQAITSLACALTKNDIVIDAHADDKDDKAEKLQCMELLPPHGQRNAPNDQGSDTV